MSDDASSTSRAPVIEALQTIEGALQVALTALERLAPTARRRRWQDALAVVHGEVLDEFPTLSTGQRPPD